jgi:transposase-like protein
MRDTPDDMTPTVACPACESENVETLPAAGADGDSEYRCLNCETEFDIGGGEPPLADSNDPHAP